MPGHSSRRLGLWKEKVEGRKQEPEVEDVVDIRQVEGESRPLAGNEVEAAGDNADAAGTTGTSVTTPLLVAQVPQSAPAAAVVPGAVPSPTSGTSPSLWISARTGKEKPSKPPLHLLPLTKYNSNDDVNRNKWEEVPGFDRDSRDL